MSDRSASSLVQVQSDEGLALLTLSAPPVNGDSYAMMRALDAASKWASSKVSPSSASSQAELFASEDAREGLAAYTDERKPTFRGR